MLLQRQQGPHASPFVSSVHTQLSFSPLPMLRWCVIKVLFYCHIWAWRRNITSAKKTQWHAGLTLAAAPLLKKNLGWFQQLPFPSIVNGMPATVENSLAVPYATRYKPTLKPTAKTLVHRHLENNAYNNCIPNCKNWNIFRVHHRRIHKLYYIFKQWDSTLQ